MFNELEKDMQGFMKPEEIMKYIKGINFPTNKQNIVNTLKSNNAPQQLVSAADRLPDKTYNSPQDFVNDVKSKLSKPM